MYEVLTTSEQPKPGLWPETFGSKAELRAFLRGMKVASAMMGKFFTEPEVP